MGNLIASTSMDHDAMPTDFYKYPCPVSLCTECEYSIYKQTDYGYLEMRHFLQVGVFYPNIDNLSGMRGWLVRPINDNKAAGCPLPDGLDQTSPYILSVDGAECSLSDNMQNATAIFHYNYPPVKIPGKYHLHRLWLLLDLIIDKKYYQK